MVKKKDQKKMDLSTFLNDEATGSSWADEMNSLPTAPAMRDENDPTAGMRRPDRDSHRDRGSRYDRSDRGGFGDRDREPRREHHEVPLPDKPPFTAYVGNLGFDSRETELEEWISEGDGGERLEVISVRFVKTPDDKLKGFGYVEFSTRDHLVSALKKDGGQFGGRLVKISVAEPPKERQESRSGGDRWERTGPLPPLASTSSSRQSSLRHQVSPDDDVDRGDRMGFGSKFVPSTDSPSSSGFGRSGGGFSRSVSERGMSRQSSNNEGDRDRGDRMGFGSKFVPSTDDSSERKRDGGGGRDLGSSWRNSANLGSGPGNMGLRRTASGFGSDRSGGLVASPTMERRRLDLTPRSIPNSPMDAASGLSAESKPSPFGAAKPIDTSAREREIEERGAQEKEEATKGKSDEEKKAREEEERKKRANPFGQAKAVDVRDREKEIEARLEKEKTELKERTEKEKNMERTNTERKDDRPREREGRTPQLGGKFVPSDQRSPPREQRTRSQQGFQRATSNQGSARQPSTPTNPTGPSAPKPQSFRKEGFSYSSMASNKSGGGNAGNDKDQKSTGTVGASELNGVVEEVNGMQIDV